MSDVSYWDEYEIPDLEDKGIISLGRGNIISKIDIQEKPGGHPIYSSSAKGDGIFGKYSDYMFDEEMITWSIDGGGALFYRSKHKFSVTNVCGYMRLDTSIFDYRFVHAALCLQHSRIKFDYQTKAHPSVIRNLYRIPIPPLPEQKKIAEILSGIDAVACHHRTRAEKCQELIAATEERIFDVFRNDDLGNRERAELDGKEVFSLGDIFDFRNGLNYSKRNAGTGLKIVGVGDFKNYRIPKYESLGELSPDGLDFGLSLLEEGDFLFVRSNGNRLLIGRCLSIERIPEGIPVVHSGFTIRARFKRKNSYSTNYIKQLLQSRVFRRSVAGLGGGTNISNLSQDILAETMIAFPSTSEQEKVSSGLLAIQDFYELTQIKLKQLEATKVALTSDLLSGRKRVNI